MKAFTLNLEGATEIVFARGRAETLRLVEAATLQERHSADVNALVCVRHALRELRALRRCANPSCFLRNSAAPREHSALRAFAPSRENLSAGNR